MRRMRMGPPLGMRAEARLAQLDSADNLFGLSCLVGRTNQPVEVASLRPELPTLVGLPGRLPDLVMRFRYGAALPFSMRRPAESIIIS